MLLGKNIGSFYDYEPHYAFLHYDDFDEKVDQLSVTNNPVELLDILMYFLKEGSLAYVDITLEKIYSLVESSNFSDFMLANFNKMVEIMNLYNELERG